MKIIRLALLLSVATLVAAQTTKYEAPAFSASYPTPSVDSKGVTFDIKDVTFTDSSVVGQKGQTGRYVLLTEKETAAFVVTYTDAPFEPIATPAAIDHILDLEVGEQKLTDVSGVTRTTTTISGYNSRELSQSGTMPGGTKIHFYTRVAFQGHRGWLLDAFYTDDSKFTAQDVENFFNSVAIR